MAHSYTDGYWIVEVARASTFAARPARR